MPYSAPPGSYWTMLDGVPTPNRPRNVQSYNNAPFNSRIYENGSSYGSNYCYGASAPRRPPFDPTAVDPALRDLPASHNGSINYRREQNYKASGVRQDISPDGMTRNEVENLRAASGYDDGTSLFIPQLPDLPEFDAMIDAPGFDLNLARPSSSRRSRTTTTTRDRSTSPPRNGAGAVGECTCRISCACAIRPANLVDCEPLVPEAWFKFTGRLDPESYEKHREILSDPSGRTMSLYRLNQIGGYLLRIENLPVTDQRNREVVFRGIRQWIFDVMDREVRAADLQATNVLTQLQTFLGNSQAQMRRDKGITPWIEEELTVITRKFETGDLSFHRRRGLTAVDVCDVNGTAYRTYYKLDKTWQFYKSADYFGTGTLVNGQIWFSREELMRDGVHGAIQAGIYGTINKGAYSVVMGLHTKENKYADIDEGDTIHYQGTALPVDKNTTAPPSNARDPDEDTRKFDTTTDVTRCTRTLMTSLRTGKPVRLIRTFRLAPCVTNRPKKGYRYDGLYKVTAQTPRTELRQCWVFTMKRLPGQGPLRMIENRAVIHLGGTPAGWSQV